MCMKSREFTAAQVRNQALVFVDPYNTRPVYGRTWQMRKRSLTSLGWKYHV